MLKWKHVTMDFFIGLPKTSKHHNGIWVVVDILTREVYVIVIRITFMVEQFYRLIHLEDNQTTYCAP